MPFITVDPYYSNTFYNECKEALKNNGVDFEVYISIKPPYNWYFKIDDKPVMVNYDVATESMQRWMVNTIQTLRPNEDYVFLRRNNDNGPKALLKFIENKPLKEARESNYAVFFNVQNREAIEQLTKEYPGKIWYMGKYYSNKFKVCLCTDRIIRGFLNKSQILVEKEGNTLSEPGQLEAELNWKVFRGNDHLIKFTDTPYFQGSQYKKVKIQGEHSSRFLI